MSSLFYNTFGALLLGTFVSLPLYGITLAQTVQYFRLYPSDRKLLKSFVAAIFISDTIHSAILIHICYYYLVVNYLSLAALWINIWSVDLLPVLMGMTIVLTQGFYAWRIYIVAGARLRKFRILVCIVVFFLFAEFGLMIASSILDFRSSMFFVVDSFTHWIDFVAFTIAAVVDIVLTVAFVTIMRQCRTGFKGTDAALGLLARYAMFATALLSTLAIPSFVCLLVLDHSFVYIAISTPVTKICTNSVLAVLNCRKSLPSPGSLNTNVLATDGSQESGNIRLSLPQDCHTRHLSAHAHGNRALAEGDTLSDVVIDIGIACKRRELGRDETA